MITRKCDMVIGMDLEGYIPWPSNVMGGKIQFPDAGKPTLLGRREWPAPQFVNAADEIWPGMNVTGLFWKYANLALFASDAEEETLP